MKSTIEYAAVVLQYQQCTAELISSPDDPTSWSMMNGKMIGVKAAYPMQQMTVPQTKRGSPIDVKSPILYKT